MEENIAGKAVKGTVWSAIDRFGTMGLQLIVNLVLARLLTPDDFGSIGMLMIFITVSQVFADGGFGSALIQKKEPTQTDYSTIFFWNVGIGCLLYAVLFLCAPAIAAFYHMPVLGDVLRVIGLTIILSCISNIQTKRLQKTLRFKAIAITDIGTFVAGGITGIFMAFNGYGIWSLVSMMVVQGLARIFILYTVSRWVPQPAFSVSSFRQLFSFGGYLFLSNLMETVCRNLQGLVIGRRFSAAQMGYYSQASKLDNITSCSIPQVIAAVMYPVFSRFQDDKGRLRHLVEMDLRIISLAIYPLLSILIIVAEPLIKFLYGAPWIPSAPYFSILCFGGYFMCLNNIPYYVVAACGRSRELFLASFYKWGMLGFLMLIGMNFGMSGIMWSISASLANVFMTNVFLAKRYTSVSYGGIVKALAPTVGIVTAAGMATALFSYLTPINWFAKSIFFIAIYFAGIIIIRPKAYAESKAMLQRIIKKER